LFHVICFLILVKYKIIAVKYLFLFNDKIYSLGLRMFYKKSLSETFKIASAKLHGGQFTHPDYSTSRRMVDPLFTCSEKKVKNTLPHPLYRLRKRG